MWLSGVGRDVGVTGALQGAAARPVLLAFALVTQLGDVWFLSLLGGTLYVTGGTRRGWRVARRRGLFVLGLVVTYVALVGALKQLFALPRPPGAGTPVAAPWVPAALDAAVADVTTADGAGFPSGHALGTTMVWGGLALVLERGTTRQRVGAAGAVVVLVSVSRLVLGVHYAVDVVAGVAVGVLALGALYRLAGRGFEPGRLLLVAAAVGTARLAIDPGVDGAAAAGSAVGAWVAWRGIADRTPAQPTSGRAVLAGLVVLGVAGGLFAAVYAVDPSRPLAFLGAAVAAGGVTAAPLFGEQLG
jgi:membrane-associated phospholipid phosphatase